MGEPGARPRGGKTLRAGDPPNCVYILIHDRLHARGPACLGGGAHGGGLNLPLAKVWLIDLAKVTPGGWEQLSATLDDAERARADRFVPPGRRAQHIAAHGLKRLVLSSLLATAPGALTFRVGDNGKPRLAEPSGLDFSLSHCDGLVGIAVAKDGVVGLDLEPKARSVDERVAAQMFSVAERAWLSQRPPTHVPMDRLRLWTLKEAYVKATGEGLSASLASFSIALDPPRLVERHPDKPAGWRLWQAETAPAHLIAIATRGAAPSPVFAGPDLPGMGCMTIEAPGTAACGTRRPE